MNENTHINIRHSSFNTSVVIKINCFHASTLSNDISFILSSSPSSSSSFSVLLHEQCQASCSLFSCTNDLKRPID